MGIPQLESISYSKAEFGLMTSSESLVYTYVSSLYYIKDDKYQPFLFTLFEKRKYFNSFSAYGALALLELAILSPSLLDYLLSLPAPSNAHLTQITSASPTSAGSRVSPTASKTRSTTACPWTRMSSLTSSPS